MILFSKLSLNKITKISILIIFLALCNYSPGLAQDEDYLEYFPMEIGNRWDYISLFGGGGTFDDSTHKIVTVTGDTIFSNNRYFILHNKYSETSLAHIDANLSGREYDEYARIDSTEFIVYFYSVEDSVEYPRYKLDASVGDTIEFGWNLRCTDESYLELFGFQVLTKSFKEDDVYGVSGYSLSRGFGLIISFRYAHGGDFLDHLIGARINGRNYGTLVSVKHQNVSSINYNFEIHSYPNPFSSSTIIRYELPLAGNVEISIYNILGDKLITLFNGYRNRGNYIEKWDSVGFESGIYFIVIKVGGFNFIRKCCLIR